MEITVSVGVWGEDPYLLRGVGTASRWEGEEERKHPVGYRHGEGASAYAHCTPVLFVSLSCFVNVKIKAETS